MIPEVYTPELKSTFLDSWASKSQEAQNFLCCICLQIVERPKQCPKCNTIYCGECINTWSAKNSGCPKCRNNIPKYEDINPVLQSILNKMEVSCPNCEKGCSITALPYSSLKEHLKNECGYQEVTCIHYHLGCNFYGLKKDRDAHLKNDCNYVSICTECHQKIIQLTDPHLACLKDLLQNLEIIQRSKKYYENRLLNYQKEYGALLDHSKEDPQPEITGPWVPRTDSTRTECKFCHRMFNNDRIERHQKACESAHKSRPIFYSELQREAT